MPSRDPGNFVSTETLLASAARTVAGDTGAWYGFAPINTIRLQLDVTAITGVTPSLAVFVEDSLDTVNWNVLATFAAKTAISREVLNVTSPFGDLVRVRWTITGTTASATFSVIGFSQGANY